MAQSGLGVGSCSGSVRARHREGLVSVVAGAGGGGANRGGYAGLGYWGSRGQVATRESGSAKRDPPLVRTMAVV